MKVCTDACIFGAYVPVKGAKNILDIGSGTGLLSLMMAQRADSYASITAVEINKDAYQQSLENFSASKYKSRIKNYHSSIQAFTNTSRAKYDLIISNPPFFKNNLKSREKAKDQALHATDLPPEALAEAVVKLLDPRGCFFVMLPEYESGRMKNILKEYGAEPFSKLNVRDRKGSGVLRVITEFSFVSEKVREEELLIKKRNGAYSKEFVDLLKEYYLYL